MDNPTPLGTRKLASVLRDHHKKLMALRPMRSAGTLTSVTSQGVTRKAKPGTDQTGGGSEARWS